MWVLRAEFRYSGRVAAYNSGVYIRIAECRSACPYKAMRRNLTRVSHRGVPVVSLILSGAGRPLAGGADQLHLLPQKRLAC